MTMQITYISVRIIQFMERSTKNFRIRKARRWLQMYLPVSCPSLYDVEKYGVIYGGVQKNIGPAGVVIAIIREDLIT